MTGVPPRCRILSGVLVWTPVFMAADVRNSMRVAVEDEAGSISK
jgi:hypothetical protein